MAHGTVKELLEGEAHGHGSRSGVASADHLDLPAGISRDRRNSTHLDWHWRALASRRRQVVDWYGLERLVERVGALVRVVVAVCLPSGAKGCMLTVYHGRPEPPAVRVASFPPSA